MNVARPAAPRNNNGNMNEICPNPWTSSLSAAFEGWSCWVMTSVAPADAAAFPSVASSAARSAPRS